MGQINRIGITTAEIIRRRIWEGIKRKKMKPL